MSDVKLAKHFQPGDLVALLDNDVTYLNEVTYTFGVERTVPDSPCYIGPISDIFEIANKIASSEETAFTGYFPSCQPDSPRSNEKEYRTALRFLSKTLKKTGKILFIHSEHHHYYSHPDFLDEISDVVIRLFDDIESDDPKTIGAEVIKARGREEITGLLPAKADIGWFGEKVLMAMLCRESKWFIDNGLENIGMVLRTTYVDGQWGYITRPLVETSLDHLPMTTKKKRITNILNLLRERDLPVEPIANDPIREKDPTNKEKDIEGDDSIYPLEPIADTSTAIQDVKYECERQVSKGYDTLHDDRNVKGSHVQAGIVYATVGLRQRQGFPLDEPTNWPWPIETYSPDRNPRSNLIKAAALILAEVARIDREDQNS